MIMYDTHAPEESAWSTLGVNKCHTPTPSYQQDHALGATGVATCDARIDDINSKVVQMHQDGAALRVCVRIEAIYSSSLSVILSECD